MILSPTRILYANFQICTLNYGYISQWFSPSRGLFQDNPAAGTYFLLVIKILGENIRENPLIEDISISGYNFKSVQFADDMNLFSLFLQQSVREIINTLMKFKVNMGLKLNYEKGFVCRIGSAKNLIARLYTSKQLHWTDDPVKVLGVYIYQMIQK